MRDFPNALRANEYRAEPRRSRRKYLLEIARGRFDAADSSRIDPTSEQYGRNLLSRVRAMASPWSPVVKEDLEEIHEEILSWQPKDDDVIDMNVVEYRNLIDVKNYLLGILAFRLQDDQLLGRYVEQADRRDAESAENESTAVANILKVLQAARNADAETAIQRFHDARIPLRTFWDSFSSPLYTQDFSRLIISELLFEHHRYEEALPWFESIFSGWDMDGMIYAAPVHLRRAQIHENRGEIKDAIKNYEVFIDYWRDADPELQPMVEEARERIDVLMQSMVAEPAE